MQPMIHMPRRHCSGFTVIEWLVAIAVMAMTASLLLPAMQSVRETMNRDSVISVEQIICVTTGQYREKYGKYPDDIRALIDARLLDPYHVTPDGRIVEAGYAIELIFNADEIEEQLRHLETLGDDGEEAARKLRDLQPDFLIFGRPIVPGRTGYFLIYTGGGEEYCWRFTVVDPDCVELQIEMFRRIETEGVKRTATLLPDDEDAQYVYPFVTSPEVTQNTFELVDIDSDGKATFSDLRQIAGQKQLTAENADGNFDNFDATPIVVLQEFLQYALYDEMQIGAGNEQIDDLGVTLDELPDDSAMIFSSENYGRLIDDLVDQEGVAASLTAKVRAAESARQRWEASDPETRDDEAEACGEIVEAFRRELWAQEGKSIRFEDALLLDAVVGVLCPKVEQSLD
jgi:type II secretory pathway pseudopilin PulG